MKRNFDRNVARIRVNLTLNRSEAEELIRIFRLKSSDMADHIKQQVEKAIEKEAE